VTELWRVLRDAKVSTTLVFGAVVVVGFTLIGQGYRGVAATLFVPFQVPFLMSGAVAGLALVGAGLALLNAHLDRTEAAEERRNLVELQRETMQVLTLTSQRAPEDLPR
jgi:hypothetical protein